jgi:putative ABC transport system permease protein
MKGALLLAWRSNMASWGRNALLMIALGTAAGLPVAAGRALQDVQRALHARAQSTPLVAGPPGSPLDLVLRATEFTGSTDAPSSMPRSALPPSTADCAVMPLVLGAAVRAVPVVGAPLEYLEWRGLQPALGRNPAILGECVLGANAAAQLQATVEDRLATRPDQVYSMAGSYPVRMRVAGVLQRTNTADDDVIFVSLETAWLIAGIGHGHQELDQATPVDLLIRKDPHNVTASAAVREYIEVKPENIDSFHFHGDESEFPVNAAIVVPSSAKQGALLMGRADAAPAALQVVRPADVVDALFAKVFRVRDLLALVFVVVFAAAALLAATLAALVVRVRAPQMALLQRVGASRGFVARMLGAELALVAGGAAVIAGLLAALAPLLQPILRAQLG